MNAPEISDPELELHHQFDELIGIDQVYTGGEMATKLELARVIQLLELRRMTEQTTLPERLRDIAWGILKDDVTDPHGIRVLRAAADGIEILRQRVVELGAEIEWLRAREAILCKFIDASDAGYGVPDDVREIMCGNGYAY